MSIAELFESGEKKSSKGHFRNLIMIARADGVVTESEQEMLDKMGRKIGLSPEQIKEVIDNPDKYPINPPVDKEDRFNRLIGLIEMLAADDTVDNAEVSLIRRYGIGLGFDEDQLVEHGDVIIQGIIDGKDKHDILEALMA